MLTSYDFIVQNVLEYECSKSIRSFSKESSISYKRNNTWNYCSCVWLISVKLFLDPRDTAVIFEGKLIEGLFALKILFKKLFRQSIRSSNGREIMPTNRTFITLNSCAKTVLFYL